MRNVLSVVVCVLFILGAAGCPEETTYGRTCTEGGNECEPDALVCDVVTGSCVAADDIPMCDGGYCSVCDTNADCTDGRACNGGRCVACDDDQQCSAGNLCIESRCVPGDCHDRLDCVGDDICTGNFCSPPDCEDTDEDGYGPNCAPGPDCSPDNASLHTIMAVFTDVDGDGYTVGESLGVCSSGTVPVGYAETESATPDCNDLDATVFISRELYVDDDGDTYTVGAATAVCTDGGVPMGYAENASAADDCDDTSSAIGISLTGYVDADEDGATVGGEVTLCTDGSLPAGYQAAASGTEDCADDDAARSPAFEELCDTIDNNCDGIADLDTNVAPDFYPCECDLEFDASDMLHPYLFCTSTLAGGAMNWNNAQLYCRNLPGYDLAIEETVEEHDALRAIVGVVAGMYGVSGAAYVGLSDDPNRAEGSSEAGKPGWRWIDGSTVDYDGWLGGEPNNSGNEDCGILTANGWNDGNCGNQAMWICEPSRYWTGPVAPYEPPTDGGI